MKRRGQVAYALRRLLSNFWVVPAAMAVAAFAAAAGTLSLDAAGLSEALKPVGPPFDIAKESASELLSTLAGAMVTVVSLVFSLTLVTLTVAAGNLGARLLERYMQNTVTQVTMGLFVGSFVYTVLVLSAVGSDPIEVPRLSVVLALAMAILSVCWLMYAFQDLASSLQIDQAAAEIAGALQARIATAAGLREDRPGEAGELPERMAGVIEAARTGYIEAIDWGLLGDLARRHDVVLDVVVSQGGYLTPHDPLVRLYGDGTVDDDAASEIRGAITFGDRRTDADDLMFLVHLLVEVAARALSPGVNDLYTALACADHLSGSIAQAVQCGLVRVAVRDDDGRLRVRTRSADISRMVETTFGTLRRNGVHNLSFALRLIRCIERLGPLAAGRPLGRDLLRHLELIREDAAAGAPQADREALDEAADRARAACVQ